MAQIKFSELPEITTRDSTTELVVLHGTPSDNAKITADNFLTGISGGSSFLLNGTSIVRYRDFGIPFNVDTLNSYIQIECDPAMYGLQGEIQFSLSNEILGLGVSTNPNLFIIDEANYPSDFNDYYCQGNYNPTLNDLCDNVPPAVFEIVQYNLQYTSSSTRYDYLSKRKVIKDDGTGVIKTTLDTPIDATTRFIAIQVFTDGNTNQGSYNLPTDLATGFDDPFDRFCIRAFFENGTNRIHLSAYPKTSEQ